MSDDGREWLETEHSWAESRHAKETISAAAGDYQRAIRLALRYREALEDARPVVANAALEDKIAPWLHETRAAILSRVDAALTYTGLDMMATRDERIERGRKELSRICREGRGAFVMRMPVDARVGREEPGVSVMLTRRQSQVVEFVREFVTEKGHSPTLTEIAHHLGLRSVSGIHRVVSELVDRGVLERAAGARTRSLQVRSANDFEGGRAHGLREAAQTILQEVNNTPAVLSVANALEKRADEIGR